MKTITKLVLTVALILPFSKNYAQCTLNLFASPDTVVCGGCVTLSAYGNMDGNIAFQENFNSGSPIGWQFTQTVTIGNNTCGVPSPDGTDFMWMGDASVNPRDMTTVGFDLTLGGTVCFEMRYSIQGDASPCEGPDEPDEGVYLQYSTNGGTNWTNINYWDPNGGNDPGLTSWNQYCFAIPSGAMTANTMIRWHQDAVSGAVYDHWGIDNVIITLNDPNSSISWLHDSYTYPLGSSGGVNPTQICLSNDSTFTAQITNGVNTCTQTITVGVKNPVVTVSAAPDTSICPGECVQIVGESKVVISPASTPTYTNAQTSIVTSGSADMNINVTGLNQTSLTSSSITEVCLTGFNFSGTQICTTFGGCNCNGTPIAFGATCNLNISSFDVILTTPNGCQITLVPAGVATGTNYTNVCFVPSGGGNITGGGFPTSGNWNPSQPFSNLNGCTPNGVWNLEVNAPGGLGFGVGTLQGWSISFDDPEISYPASFSWNPTTNMTNSNTLNPTVCPTSNTTYTITASDSNNCVIATDNVTINMSPSCCSFDVAAVTTSPSCANNDGGIDITVSNGSGNYSFDWGGGIVSEDLVGIGSGTYTVTITDITQGCSKDTIIVLSPSGNAPFIDSVTVVHTSCGNVNGTITISVSGGTGSLLYSIDNDVTTQSGNQFLGLISGAYDVVVTDSLGCKANQQVMINPSTALIIDSIIFVNPSCGVNNGSISIFSSGGNGTLTYSINNGSTFQLSNSFNGLASGNYTIVVKDASNCQTNQIVAISAAGAPVISNVSTTNPTCNNNNGVVVVSASGGVGSLSYSIDNGATFQSSSTFSGLNDGAYTIVVKDSLNCQTTQVINLIDAGYPSITSINSIQPSCGNSNGSITINVSGGTGMISYSINNGTTSQSGNSFTGLASATYDIVVTDSVGCLATQQVVLIMANAPTISNVSVVDENCSSVDGQITVTASGNGTLTYSIDNGTTTQVGNSFLGLSTGTYDLVVIDNNGCSTSQQVVVGQINAVNASFVVSPTSGLAPLEVTFSNQSTGATSYQWIFGDGNSSILTNPSNTYNTYGDFVATLIATDGFGCFDTARVVIVVSDQYSILIPNVFTPNGDNKNDNFLIKTTFIEELNVLIYNRWGLKMYEITSPSDFWDGGDATDGTYFFILKAKSFDGVVIEKTGTVTLLH
ncbi:MAG: gliding motility-associated C-terminal domain-containing protein [Flavobacteriales bacterium]|nr:gliding motility-associated C-terminal domain-containing protein [Flavobacteriales bacterium]